MTDQQKTDHIGEATQMIDLDHAELLRQLRLVRSSGARAGKPWNDDGPAAADAIEALLSDNAALRDERDEAVALLREVANAPQPKGGGARFQRALASVNAFVARLNASAIQSIARETGK